MFIKDSRCFVILIILLRILVALGVVCRMMRFLTVEPPFMVDGESETHESGPLELLAGKVT